VDENIRRVTPAGKLGVFAQVFFTIYSAKYLSVQDLTRSSRVKYLSCGPPKSA
jgi:hypothetical protein